MVYVCAGARTQRGPLSGTATWATPGALPCSTRCLHCKQTSNGPTAHQQGTLQGGGVLEAMLFHLDKAEHPKPKRVWPITEATPHTLVLSFLQLTQPEPAHPLVTVPPGREVVRREEEVQQRTPRTQGEEGQACITKVPLPTHAQHQLSKQCVPCPLHATALNAAGRCCMQSVRMCA